MQTLGPRDQRDLPRRRPGAGSAAGGSGGGGRGGRGGGFPAGAPGRAAATGRLGAARPAPRPARRTAPPAAGPAAAAAFGRRVLLNSLVAYAKAHGGGTIAVSSQSGRGVGVDHGSDANVAAIGGFSGRESEVSGRWLAAGGTRRQIRWVVADGGGMGGIGNDGRVGASAVMAAVQQTCTKVTVNGTTIYDLSGKSDALQSAG